MTAVTAMTAKYGNDGKDGKVRQIATDGIRRSASPAFVLQQTGFVATLPRLAENALPVAFSLLGSNPFHIGIKRKCTIEWCISF